MKNIDEDIKIVKKIIEDEKDVVEHFKKDTFSNYPIEESENEIQALENVLKALEGKDCVIETQAHNEEVYEERITKLEKELETYKKIAKKLAEELKWLPIGDDATDFILFKKVEEAIDWARKEAEKDL